MTNLSHELFHTGFGVYLLVFYGAALLGTLQLLKRRQAVRFNNWAMVALLLIIFIPTLIQLFWLPDLLTWLRRDTLAVTEQFQIWRVLTSVFVQSGAFGGAVLNLTSLVLLAPLVQTIYGSKRLWAFFWIAALAGQIAGLFLLPIGGGNSVGNMGLAGLILVGLILRGDHWIKLAATAILATGLFSLSWLDIHGFALIAAVLAASYLAAHRQLFR